MSKKRAIEHTRNIVKQLKAKWYYSHRGVEDQLV